MPDKDDASHAPPADVVTENVPVWLRVSAAWGWRLIVVGIVLLVLFQGFTTLSSVVLPLGIALLIAAPLEQMVSRLQKWGVPRTGGALLAILTLVVVVLGLGVAAGSSIVAGFGDLRDAALAGFDQFLDWLVNGPIHMSREQIDQVIANATSTLQDNAWGVASGAASVTGTLGSLFAGSIVALFALFFFMKDGRRLWLWFVGLLPRGRSEKVDRAGMTAWLTLRRYTETSVFVAFIDALGIGLGAWILGIPLALPIAIFVFLLSFIPLFGATISGAIAVLVALVDGGPVKALIMVGIVLLVQQLEGNILYPWLFGKAASLHPLAILLTVATGTLLLGLVGAVIAVPIVSFAYAFARALRSEYEVDDPGDGTGEITVLGEQPKDALRRAREAIARTGEIRVRRHRGADQPRGTQEQQGPEA
ncbi:AI-2E family transporter [Demequina lignilytica]|uniref:AI-2E family transporter n=1 Tax=Demequina lignilytica TaxID=3051663 RepID=A0AAW7M963_9MICO|nr:MULTISPECIES: AI-2E family transporter [unclassified Demequina]MDN4477613.1 AI-2E family transporter [Demequina sp. SYSU T00039-1]MDN4483658.1 AI-2E family transporter [Demequina sp. SYSU T0a273]MDN4488036.1 AI-2E family transporter [Demequina sp. SYSU T00039]MDN4490476.1 AI-2E family transporter [Demequina sp. SYSU T00068]